ncbi:MAG: ECF transporter S component [Bacteroidota bacterium]|nr:ECF transporter S component [Bacteroidota bacterium]
MSISESSIPSYRSSILPYTGMQTVYVQAMLISSAVALPILAHALNTPVRYLLPMHWTVILAGMLYGWRAGAITGALAPLLSYLISGYPLPNILPSMTAELFVYGVVTGILRQRFNANAFVSIGVSIILGRIVFIVFVILTNRATISDLEYFKAALVPGFSAALLQILSLPFLSTYIVKKYRNDGTY